jgi:phosphoglycerate dehydrogenase-like enzyme
MPSSDTIRVIVAMNFSDEIMAQLRAVSPRYQIERHFPNVPDSALAEAEILYTGAYFPDPARASHLRWIQMHSAGIDHAAHQPIIQAEDVEVTTTSGIHATPIAEYCMMMMLAFAYKLPTMLRLQAKAEWPEKQRSVFSPRELRGQTLGIVGYGSIGRELARLADSFDMTVLAAKRDVMHPELPEDKYQESGIGDPTGQIPARLYPPEALASMAQECDFLVLIAPLTGDTSHLVNEAVLGAMKKTAVLINVARGNIVDEAALISALAAGRIAGAALDVFEEEPLPSTSPLWGMENVIISPHVAGNSSRYHEKAAALFAENLQRYIEKRPLLNKLERKRGF